MNAQPQHVRTFHEILADWERSKSVLEQAKQSEMTLRKEAFAAGFEEPKEGTNRVALGNGYELKAVRKVNYTLDKDQAKVRAVWQSICNLGNEGSFIAERLFKWSVDFSAGEYKKLKPDSAYDMQIKAMIDNILTTSDGAPTLSIEAPKGN